MATRREGVLVFNFELRNMATRREGVLGFTSGLRNMATRREGVLGFTSGLRNMATRREGVLGFTSGLRNMATRREGVLQGERVFSASLLSYVTWPQGERALSRERGRSPGREGVLGLTFELRNMATRREGVLQGERAFSRERGRSRLHF